MGNNQPSPRDSGCRSGRQVGKGVVNILQGRISRARWAAGQTKSSIQQGRASGGDAKGDQSGVEQHSGAWNSAVSAVGWNLPQLYLESGVLHPSGSLDRCLGTPETKWGISPGAYLWVVLLCRHSCSDHVCRYLTCVSLPHVFALV